MPSTPSRTRPASTLLPTVVSLGLAVVLLCTHPASGDGSTSTDPNDPPTWTVDPEASLFAVVTHTAGIGSGLAHEHLVHAPKFTAELAFDPEHPEVTRFRFQAASADLVIDDPATRSAWQDRLLEADIASEPFADLDAEDRAKIRESMVADDQLDVAGHPRLSAELVALAAAAAADDDDGEASHGHRLRLAFTLRGVTVERDLAADFRIEDDGRLIAWAHGTYAFTDFGIEPYSAMFGAVRNADTFHVFVHLEAEPPAAGDSTKSVGSLAPPSPEEFRSGGPSTSVDTMRHGPGSAPGTHPTSTAGTASLRRWPARDGR